MNANGRSFIERDFFVYVEGSARKKRFDQVASSVIELNCPAYDGYKDEIAKERRQPGFDTYTPGSTDLTAAECPIRV